MRLSSFTLTAAAIAANLGLVHAGAFQNTGPLLVSVKRGPGVKYVGNAMFDGPMVHLNKVNDDMELFTENYCSENPEKSISLVKVYGLSNDLQIKGLFDAFDDSIVEYLIYDVIYQNPVNDELSMSSACHNVEVSMLEFDEGTISEIKTISEESDADIMLIQFPPKFAPPSESLLKEITSSVYNKLVANGVKREEIDYDTIEQELQNSFEEVDELLDEEIVSIYESEDEYSVGQKASSRDVVSGSLFDKYTFFSDGIWMAIIVVAFLIILLSIVLSWLSSMKTSYGAFEKPVDFEKKLQ
jgi:uncharacterized protein YheU (UPF0270 family)